MKTWQPVCASVVWKTDRLLILSSCPHFAHIVRTGDPDERAEADSKVALKVSQQRCVLMENLK